MTSYLGAYYGEHRRADAQTSCDSARSPDSSDHRAQPLLITGNKTRDEALGDPRIRAGEIVGWRFWKLYNGLLFSVFASYVWSPGVFERSSCKQCSFQNVAFRDNPGYHAFINKEQAKREAFIHACWSLFFFSSAATSEIYTFHYTALFRWALACR